MKRPKKENNTAQYSIGCERAGGKKKNYREADDNDDYRSSLSSFIFVQGAK